jgi:hypothetical protein
MSSAPWIKRKFSHVRNVRQVYVLMKTVSSIITPSCSCKISASVTFLNKPEASN